VKHLILPLAVCLGALAAACSGNGGSSTTPPPPPLGFTNADLNGQYAFEMSGSNGNGGLIARVGSFSANGSGTITAAVEDVNSGGVGFSTVQFTGGTYSIGSDGRGTLSLTGGSLGGALGLNIALSSKTGGVAVQTDGNAVSSGSFDLQTANSFTLTAIKGTYAFDLSGQDGNGAPLAIVGEFAAVGTGALTSGTVDVNDGGGTGISGPNPIPSNSTAFVLDPNFSSSGRGTASINGQTLAFYVVDGTRLRFLEEDSVAITVGDAFLQTGTIPTQVASLNGNFAFISAGAAVLGNFGTIARAGSGAFSAGSVSTIFLDDNNAGNHHAAGPDSGGSYTIDSAGSGRGTFTFTDSSLGKFSYIFYLFSPTQALLMEISNGLIGSGSMSAQPSSVSASALAGNYVFNWSGVTIPSSGNVGFEEDFIGQYVQASSGSLTGTSDFTEPGSTSNRQIFTSVPLTGMFNASGTGRNAYQVTVSPGSGAPSSTINFAAYVAAGNTIYVVSTDSNRVTAGSVTVQGAP
jgi:hypothetical protein